jgi:hypothetical protein
VKRSIYISRKVLNINEIKDWLKQQGLTSCLAEEMHVTVAFDHKKHDWRDLPIAEGLNEVDVVNPDERSVELFRNGAVVLEIYSTPLHARWGELVQAGLHWKFQDYRPHITLTYTIPEGMDLSRVEPFDGVIKLGPEIATQVVWQAREQLIEEAL